MINIEYIQRYNILRNFYNLLINFHLFGLENNLTSVKSQDYHFSTRSLPYKVYLLDRSKKLLDTFLLDLSDRFPNRRRDCLGREVIAPHTV